MNSDNRTLLYVLSNDQRFVSLVRSEIERLEIVHTQAQQVRKSQHIVMQQFDFSPRDRVVKLIEVETVNNAPSGAVVIVPREQAKAIKRADQDKHQIFDVEKTGLTYAMLGAMTALSNLHLSYLT